MTLSRTIISPMCPSEASGGTLTINLDAIARNYRTLGERVAPGECAGVVKADAYGLGAGRVAPALAAAGCRRFFVADLNEGLSLRKLLPDAEIAVLYGPGQGEVELFAHAALCPVLNEPGQVERWRRAGEKAVLPPAWLHIDTGMNRLGLSASETAHLASRSDRLEGLTLAGVMSHLACAEHPDHALNGEQKARFREAHALLSGIMGPLATSFANSSGIFLEPDYHGDLARPGAALYGVNPTPKSPNPMEQVVQLQGRIVQLREIDRSGTVGYGATRRVTRGERIATVAVGYADGYLRSLSDRAAGYIGRARIPLVGRVSMDLLTFDVSALPPAAAAPGTLVTLIGAEHPVDDLAAEADTIGYEVLTALGARYARRYVGDPA